MYLAYTGWSIPDRYYFFLRNWLRDASDPVREKNAFQTITSDDCLLENLEISHIFFGLTLASLSGATIAARFFFLILLDCFLYLLFSRFNEVIA